jgi:RHS repeat-associated protein
LRNDTDASPLTASLVGPATNGTVSLNADGSFTYVPYTQRSGEVLVTGLINLANRLPGVIVRGGQNAAGAVDENPVTVNGPHYAGNNESFVLELPIDATIQEIQIQGPAGGLGAELGGRLLVFDAAGAELYASGFVGLQSTTGLHRLTFPGGLAGVRSTQWVMDRGGAFQEFRVIGTVPAFRSAQVEPNLTLHRPVTIRASNTNSPERVVDGTYATAWYAASFNPSEFIEIEFPADVTVSAIRGDHHRGVGGFNSSLGYSCSGVFTLRGADGTVLFDSGVVNHPSSAPGNNIVAPNPFNIPVANQAGVRILRYQLSGCVAGSSFTPGFSEIEVIGTQVYDAPAFRMARRLQSLTNHEVHSTPIVINLTDDNEDGRIDANDVPDIAVPVEGQTNQLTGEIRVISGDDGRELFTAGAPNLVSPWSEIASGDIDGDGLPEIVAVHADAQHLIAFEHTGTQKWISEATSMPTFNLGGTLLTTGAVSLANLDGAGPPEIIVGATVFDANGRLIGRGDALGGTVGGAGKRSAISAVADIDLDGTPELVAGPTAYRLSNGTLTRVWSRADRPDGYVAFGNFDDDPQAEIVVVADGSVYMLNHDGTDAEVWNPPSHAAVPLPGGGQGGAPLVADVDGDGRPEIGVAGSRFLTVFNRDGAVRWQRAITDQTSSSTGSVAFDLDGDGTIEIIYRDEYFLHVFRGADGAQLARMPVGSATWSETPTVADVDNDGHADIVVSSDQYQQSPAYDRGVIVFNDFANLWTRTRRIWNQHAYHVTNVNEDGTIPLAESPHWLIPGLNGFRTNRFMPGESSDATDTFTYKASDGVLQSNEATVRINVRPVNGAPAFTSSPSVSAGRDVVYTYAARASDPDAGDILTFSLPTAPVGMTVDADSGLVRWTPGAAQIGTHDVVVKAVDVRGLFALQFYSVNVGEPVAVPNLVGQTRVAAEGLISGAALTLGTVGTRHSPTVPEGSVISQSPQGGTLVAAGSIVGIVVSLGPAPAGTVPDVVGLTQASATADIVAAQFVVGSVSMFYSTTVPLGVVLSQTPAAGTTADLGSAIAIGVSAGAPPGTLDADGDGYTGDRGDCNDTNASINPGAFDIPGDGIDQNCNGVDSVAGDATAPTAAIATPADLAEVTMPTDIVGTVSDGNFLRYTVQLAEVDATTFTTIGSGTTAVTNGVVGRLDPTLLENGLYRVRLIAEDVNGQTAMDERVYRIDGAAKVGHFRMSFIDLSVPVAGVPISVVRTYDSRVKAQRDFGIGWTLELKTGTYRHNRLPGEGWIIRDQPYLGGQLPCVGGSQETRTHLTEVRLSDRESYRFALEVTNGNLGIIGACEGTASFRFLGGTRPGATLQILGSTSVIYLRGGDDVVLDMDAFLEGTNVPYSPTSVRLTLPEGTQIDLERVAGVARIADPNGNQLRLTSQGIVHSSGKSIRFDRDAAQRITRITDPREQALTYGYDGAGDLTTFTDQAGHNTTFRYDSTHRLLEIRDALGRSSQSEYDIDGRLVAIVDPAGNRTRFGHDLDARSEAITDRLGHTTTLEYDTRGNVVRKVDPLGGISTFTYDARDNRLTETDPLGHTQAHSYDARDNVLTRTDPLGHTTSFTYSSTNQVLTQTDSRGGVTRFGYDSRDNVVSETDPAGAVTRHTYDRSGNRTSTTDASGRWTFAYDASGQVAQTSTPVGQTRTVVRDPNGNPLIETRLSAASAQPVTTQFTYDALNRRIRTIDAIGAEQAVTYTATGEVAAETDAAGGVTSFTYDEQDRLVLTVHPDGAVERAAYDAEGRIIRSTDRNSRETTFVYDALGRQVSLTYPDGATVSGVYDPAGQMITTFDELGRAASHTYDAAGRRTVTRNALGIETTTAYDANGNLVSSTDGNGGATRFEYDSANRRTRTVFPDGTSIAEAHDALGRLISRTDPAGHTTRFEYDARGALTRVIDALGNATTYTYGEFDKRVSQTDARGHTTRFAYDRLGRLVHTTLPLGQVETRSYDLAGRLTSIRNFNGATTSYAYDAMSRLTSRLLPGGEAHTFTYTPAGLLATATDPTGTTTFEYDLRDRPTRARRPDGLEIRYQHDAAGNRTAITTPSGTVVYAYDLANRLTRVTDATGAQSVLGYDPAGNLTSLGYPNGIQARYEYDTRNRVTHVSQVLGTQTLRSFHYTIGAAGNRTRVVEDTGRAVDYSYDALFRLTGETVTVPGQAPTVTTYGYDATGNRVSQTGPAGSITYVYDANDQLVQSGSRTLAYDANGNLLTTQSGGLLTTYQYDTLNRLTGASVAGAITTHTYNALGHRVRSTSSAETTQYLVDPFGADDLSQVMYETDAAGAVDYVYAGGRRLSMRRPAGPSYFLPDARDSVRGLADQTGAVTDRYDYDSFGNVTLRQGATPNEWLFAGQRLDSQTLIYDMRARYYDPIAGRFTARDPHPGIAYDPGSLHPYTYAHNDPINRSDPSGEFTLAETMAVSAGVGVLVGTGYSIHSYAYYGSAELAFELGVDAAFTFAMLTMDATGAGGMVRSLGKGVVKAVAVAMAGKTLLNQTGKNVGKTAAQRVGAVIDNAIARSSVMPQRRGLAVITQAEAQASVQAAKEANQKMLDAALDAARRQPAGVRAKGLGELTVEVIKTGYRTVVQWWGRRPRI